MGIQRKASATPFKIIALVAVMVATLTIFNDTKRADRDNKAEKPFSSHCDQGKGLVPSRWWMHPDGDSKF